MRVLVTGANGHLGLALTAQLVEAGHRGRASSRGATVKARAAPLQALGVEVDEADVLDAAAMERAAQDVEVVFHLAAPFRFVVKDPQRELIAPALRGAENALVAAHKAGARRVVMTSSTVTLGGKHRDRPLDERDWNDDAVNSYAIAKTLAERNAWRVAKQRGVDLVCINPCAMMGPGFVRHTPNTLPIASLLAGEIPLAPPFCGNYVDVRDVARAHILAAETATASGRYVLGGTHLRFLDLGKQVKTLRPAAKVPTRELPTLLFPVARMMDFVLHKTRGLPRQLSADFIEEYRDGRVTFSAARAQRELGWSARPFAETLHDTVEWIERHRPPSW